MISLIVSVFAWSAPKCQVCWTDFGDSGSGATRREAMAQTRQACQRHSPAHRCQVRGCAPCGPERGTITPTPGWCDYNPYSPACSPAAPPGAADNCMLRPYEPGCQHGS